MVARRLAVSAGAGVTPADIAPPDYDATDVAATAAVMRAAPPGVEVYAINGPFAFAGLAAFKQVLDSLGERPRTIVLRMGRVLAIDDRGLRTLGDVVRRFRREGTRVILCELHTRPRVAIERHPIMGDVGEENVAASLVGAVALAAAALAREHVKMMDVHQATAGSRFRRDDRERYSR